MLMKSGTPPSASADPAGGLLLRIAREGDKAAFAGLFRHYAPRIKAWLLRQGLAPSSAEDLAQDVMFQLWRRASLFDPKKARAATWIYTIARNRLRDERRRARSGEAARNTLGAAAEDWEPHAALDEAHDNARVHRALEQLPPEQRRLIEESYFRDHSHSRIAAAWGLPLGTVKSRLRQALSRLRQNLKERP